MVDEIGIKGLRVAAASRNFFVTSLTNCHSRILRYNKTLPYRRSLLRHFFSKKTELDRNNKDKLLMQQRLTKNSRTRGCGDQPHGRARVHTHAQYSNQMYWLINNFILTDTNTRENVLISRYSINR